MSNVQKKKTGLGRGLSALLSTPESAVNNSQSGNKSDEDAQGMPDAEINLNFIETNPFQPRKHFDEEALLELSESIKSCGVIQPIAVRKISKNKYQIISGERRFQASKRAGLSTIPARIIEATDNDMLIMALIENVQREDLNPLEIADSYQKLLDDFNFTQEELSQKVGKNRSTISNFLRMIKLDVETKKQLVANNITMGHARSLLSIDDINLRKKFLARIISEGLSVRETEKLMLEQKKNISSLSNPRILKAAIPTHFAGRIENLSKHLGAKIDVRLSPKGNGAITIPFSSEQQLEKIMELLKA